MLVRLQNVLNSGLQMGSEQTEYCHSPAVPLLDDGMYPQHQNFCGSQPNRHLTNYLWVTASLQWSLWGFTDRNRLLNYEDVSKAFACLFTLVPRTYLTSGSIKSAIFLHLLLFFSIYASITESRNHRIVEVGRDLCGSSSQTPLPKQGHLQ